MYSFREREPNSSFRFTNPNSDNYLDSLPRVERIVRPGKDEIFGDNVLVHEKKIRTRGLPPLSRVLRAANGVNSKSALVFHCVFDIAKSA